MITRAQKVRLGLFVAVSLTLFVGTIVVLTGLRLAETRDYYTVRYRMSLSGLESGAQVKFNGVRVGRVDEIRINPADVAEVIVRLSLDEGTPVKKDTKAVVNLAGITGLKFIELSGGTSDSPFVEPGGEIEPGESIFDRLTGRADVIAEKIELAVNRINLFLEDENRNRIMKVVDEIDALVVSVTATIEENRPHVLQVTTAMGESAEALAGDVVPIGKDATRAVKAFRELAENLRDGVDRAQVRRIVGNVDKIAGNIRTAVDDADIAGLAKDARGMVGAGRRVAENIDLTVLRIREDLYAALSYLLDTMENLAEFSRVIRESPGALLSDSEEPQRKLP
jgi:phospholipid/cholesterol/gamma-HCH transport system substrate-binding protein